VRPERSSKERRTVSTGVCGLNREPGWGDAGGMGREKGAHGLKLKAYMPVLPAWLS